MNSPSESRRYVFHAVLLVWLTLVSAVAAVHSVTLSRSNAETRPYRAEVDTIKESLGALERRLDDLAHQPASVSEPRFLVAQQNLAERIRGVEQTVDKLVRREELAPWDERLTTLEARVARLRQREAAAVLPHAIPEITISAQRPQPEVPFRILGTEMRGGQPFLSLAPSGASSLADVRVLRVGERWGDWQLAKLDTQAAEFVIDGHTHRIELPEQVH